MMSHAEYKSVAVAGSMSLGSIFSDDQDIGAGVFGFVAPTIDSDGITIAIARATQTNPIFFLIFFPPLSLSMAMSYILFSNALKV